jgi:hypothetical protein
VKKKEDLDEPREYFERNVWLLLILVGASAALMWESVMMLRDVNPWGTLVAVPGVIFTFQAIWLITNPYAIVYEDRFEIKNSFFYGKVVFFLDLKGIKAMNKNHLTLVYNDGDTERVILFGIRGSHRQALRTLLEKRISTSLEHRLF